MGLIGEIGSAAGGVASLLALPYQIFASERQHKTQTDQFDTQMGFARESRDLMMQREDNAIQRRVADLEAAGLHKTLALGGTGAAAGTTSTPSPGSVPSPANLSTLGQLLEFQLRTKQLDIESRLAKAQENKLNADADESRSRAGFHEGYFDIAKGDYDLRRSYFTLEEKKESRYAEADRRAAEAHALDLQYMQGLIHRQPVEYAKLVTEHARERAGLEGDQLRNMLALQEMRLNTFREEQERLRVVAMNLGIDQKRLQNIILAHDAEIFLAANIPSNDRSNAANIRNFLNAIFPGNDSRTVTARNMLQPILQSGNYALDRFLKLIK